LYFESWIVLDPKDTPLEKQELLSEDRYLEVVEEYGNDAFEAGIGAEAIRKLLEEINLEQLDDELRADLKEATSVTKKQS